MAAGTVIVRDGEVLARGCNEVNSTFDITDMKAVSPRKLVVGTVCMSVQ